LQVSLVVEELYNIWGYRRSVRIETPRGVYVAAYDEWDNCLGGSCRVTEEIIESLEECERLFTEVLEEYETPSVAGRRYRTVYECPKEPRGLRAR